MNSITLNPEINELHTLNNFILNELQKENFQVNLIAEEIFVNIVNYSKTEFITVNIEYINSTLTLEIIDNGIEFNPLLKEDPNLPNDIDEAEIGGLCIFLTKEMADELEYRRINDENHLKIIKKVEWTTLNQKIIAGIIEDFEFVKNKLHLLKNQWHIQTE